MNLDALKLIAGGLIVVGFGTMYYCLFRDHPERILV